MLAVMIKQETEKAQIQVKDGEKGKIIGWGF